MAERKTFPNRKELKAAYQEGRLSLDHLLEILAEQQKRIEEQQRSSEKQQQTIKGLKAEIDRLKQRLSQYRG